MSNWFFTEYSPSRSVIENDLRLSFWKAGFGKMFFSCTKDTVPYECRGEWGDIDFNIEWEPKNYLLLKMKAPDQKLLEAFERVLKHKAFAAYKSGNGSIVVEWRARNSNARFQELQTSGVSDLQRLDK